MALKQTAQTDSRYAILITLNASEPYATTSVSCVRHLTLEARACPARLLGQTGQLSSASYLYYNGEHVCC